MIIRQQNKKFYYKRRAVYFYIDLKGANKRLKRPNRSFRILITANA